MLQGMGIENDLNLRTVFKKPFFRDRSDTGLANGMKERNRNLSGDHDQSHFVASQNPPFNYSIHLPNTNYVHKCSIDVSNIYLD